jgi:hypothetical protein
VVHSRYSEDGQPHFPGVVHSRYSEDGQLYMCECMLIKYLPRFETMNPINKIHTTL